MLDTLKKYCIRAFAVIVAVGFLFFAMVNREVVTLKLTPFPYVIEMRLFLFTAMLVVLGIFIGWVVASFECRRRYMVKKETKQRLHALENEVVALRAQQSHAEDLPQHSSLPARHDNSAS